MNLFIYEIFNFSYSHDVKKKLKSNSLVSNIRFEIVLKKKNGECTKMQSRERPLLKRK